MKERIHTYNQAGKPVAAILIEPIQGEGGDNYASPRFFQQLQKIAKEVKVKAVFCYWRGQNSQQVSGLIPACVTFSLKINTEKKL